MQCAKINFTHVLLIKSENNGYFSGLRKIWQNKVFLWPVYSHLRTELRILSLYGSIQVRKTCLLANLRSAVRKFIHVLLIKSENNGYFSGLRKIWQNKVFLWPVYSHLRTELRILSLYRSTQVRKIRLLANLRSAVRVY